MPAKLNDWTGSPAPEGFSWKASVDQDGHTIRELQEGPYARQISALLKDVVVTLARSGNFVIIDAVPLEQRHLDEWKQALQDFRVLYVGMSAPVEILEERENKRNNRIQGSARAQFYSSSMNYGYDLVIDTNQHRLSKQISLVGAKVYPMRGYDD